MRDNEARVAQALARHFRVSFRVGEDPPDIYLEFDEGDIAVELSTLAQMVESADGSLLPRRSDDEPPLRLAEALDDEIGTQIPHDRLVLLIFSSPLNKPHKVRVAARRLILDMVRRAEEGTIDEVLKTRDGDIIAVTLSHEARPSRNKIVGVVQNRRVDYDISAVCREMLESRIVDKSLKCAKALKQGEVWLALQTDYLFADLHNLQLAMARSEIQNPFSKIILIESDGSVAMIHERKEARPTRR